MAKKFYKGWITLPLETSVPALTEKAIAFTVAGGYSTANDTLQWFPRSIVKIGEPNSSEKGWTSVKQDATAFNTPLRLADADYFYELEYDYGHVSAIRIFSLEHDSEKWYRDIEIPANTTCIDLKQILSPKQLKELDHKNVYEKKCIGLSFLGNDEKTVEEPIEMRPATDGGVKDFGFVDMHGHGDFYRAVEKAGFVWFTETPGGTFNLDVNEKILTVASNSHPLKVRLSRI